MLRILAAGLFAATLIGGAPPSTDLLSVSIEAKDATEWTATYTLPKPGTSLVFQRSPDSSRRRDWGVPTGFEIVSGSEGEELRRVNGASFGSVTLTMRPVYVELPKDYAPFAPFGDGAMLFHTGRFFACVEACPDDPSWHMSVRVRRGQSIILKGQVHRGAARWRDRDDGSYVYVGDARPKARAGVLAVVDRALPPAIGAQLDRDLPRFGTFYAARLGKLSAPPMLFASFDAGHRGGWGRQGGTLPGQVFTHFYGKRWADEMAKPEFSFDLSWHFAHEAGHLYQHGITGAVKADSWIHEGAAEAFAAIAMRDLDPADADRIDARIAAARKTCAAATAKQSLAKALESGNHRAAYSCGLILNLDIDRIIRRSAPRQDGIFSLWKQLAAGRQPNKRISVADYGAAIEPLAGVCVREGLVRAIDSMSGPLGNWWDGCAAAG